MEATLSEVGQILIKALPTFFLLLFLYVYLRSVFFKPLEKILVQRHEATEGAVRKAKESLDRAEAKAVSYEEALRSARNDIYKEQGEARRRWLEEQGQQVTAARSRADEMVKAARAQLQSEAAQARATLETDSQRLAEQITKTILQRRAA